MAMHWLRGMGILPIAFLATAARGDAPAACAMPAFVEAVSALEADGWVALPRDVRLDAAQVDALAWTLMARYATDTGGEDTATLLDLQRAAAPGLLARIDTDTTRARVLTRGADALTIVQTRTVPGRVERICRTSGADALGLPPVDMTGLDGAPVVTELVTILPEERDQ